MDHPKSGSAPALELPVDPQRLFGPETIVPSSAAQREIFFASLRGPAASRGYNQSISLFLAGALDLDALYSALLNLIDRHEALRGRFSADGEQFIARNRIPFELPVHDLRSQSASTRDRGYEALVQVERDHLFDLVEGPLFRASVIRRTETDWVLLLNCHHIIADGWSLKIMLRELPRLYTALVTRQETAGLGNPESFTRYLGETVRREQERAESIRAYWRGVYADGVPVLELPLDRPRPRVRSFAALREDILVDPSVHRTLKAVGAAQGFSQFVTLLSAFALFIHRITGQNEHIIGVPSAGQVKSGKSALLGHDSRVMPIRFVLQEQDTFITYTKRVMQVFLDAYEHQWVTIPELLRILNIRPEASRVPLVSVMFNFDSATDESIHEYAGLTATYRFNSRSAETFEISVNATSNAGELVLEWAYNTELFKTEETRLRLQQFQQLLASIASAPEEPVLRLTIVPPAQIAAMDTALNSNQLQYERELCVDQLIERSVRATPGRIAVECGVQTLTYDQLWKRSGDYCEALRAAGFGPNALVGVMLERSPEMVAALLGVWRCGAAFVPLDPAYPADHLDYMIEHSGMRVLIAQRSLPAVPAMETVRRIDVEDVTPSVHPATAFPARNPPARNSEERAYVIYTSGSTGRPKGVQVPHRALHNFLMTMLKQAPGMTADDRILAITTLSFDIAELELWLPLLAGATIVMADRATVIDGRALTNLMETARITWLQATPSTWRLLLFSGWKGHSRMTGLCGGEAFPKDLAAELLPRLGALWNVYGPTETTVWSTMDRVQAGATVTIGKPIGNTQVYVLDSCRAWVPRGCVGELWIGGDGVTLGYLGRDDLTRERYVPNPFTGRGMMYRTGDCVRLRRDGRIEYIGRNDFQVKIRGYRIELEEIEARLASHPDVIQSVVIAREDRPGDARLVAYCVSRQPFDSNSLRTHLQAVLPAYMVPHHFVELDAIPLLPNGKVNRKALPPPILPRQPAEQTAGSAPDEDEAYASHYVAPITDAESALAPIWESIFATSPIGVLDDFYALGGDSILAVKLISRIETETGYKLPLESLFDRPNIRGLAAAITNQLELAGGVIVKLRSADTKPALILIAGVGGHVFAFHKFAQSLPVAVPVYGMKAVGIDGTEPALDSIEAISERYVREILAVEPDGPYVIGGYSVGATIAFETALRLEAMGKSVPRVIMFDMSAPGYPKPASLMKRVRYHLRQISKRGLSGGLAYLRERVVSAGVDQIHREKHELEVLGVVTPEILERVSTGLLSARTRYQPSGKIKSRIELMSAGQHEDWHEAVVLTEDCGWGEFTTGGVDVHWLDAGHMDLFKGENQPRMLHLVGKVLRNLA